MSFICEIVPRTLYILPVANSAGILTKGAAFERRRLISHGYPLKEWLLSKVEGVCDTHNTATKPTAWFHKSDVRSNAKALQYTFHALRVCCHLRAWKTSRTTLNESLTFTAFTRAIDSVASITTTATSAGLPLWLVHDSSFGLSPTTDLSNCPVDPTPSSRSCRSTREASRPSRSQPG